VKNFHLLHELIQPNTEVLNIDIRQKTSGKGSRRTILVLQVRLCVQSAKADPWKSSEIPIDLGDGVLQAGVRHFLLPIANAVDVKALQMDCLRQKMRQRLESASLCGHTQNLQSP
jgi:hypothetical protein